MIIGHQNQKENIEKIFHTYKNGGFLLRGPEGVGKFSLIKEIAESKTTKDNLIIIQALKKFITKDTTNFLRNLALFHSQGNRIIIINDCHYLTTEAQNLLLKILEEIPSKTFFFFITHRPQKILTTVKSRLQPVKFGLVDSAEIQKWLKANKTEKEIKIIQDIFSGQPGLALKAVMEKEKFYLVIKFLKEKDQLKKMLLAEKITKEMELDEFLKYLIIFERINLRKNTKEALSRLKNLLQLYFDSDYHLNKNLHIKNIGINYY